MLSLTNYYLDNMNARQKKFCELYVQLNNAGRAYREAGYSEKGADQSANTLLRKPEIKEEVRAARARNNALCRMEKIEAMQFLADVIRTPINQCDGDSPLVQAVDETEGEGKGGSWRRRKVVMVSKMDALKQLAQMCGWNEPEKAHLTITDSLRELMRIRANNNERN